MYCICNMLSRYSAISGICKADPFNVAGVTVLPVYNVAGVIIPPPGAREYGQVGGGKYPRKYGPGWEP